MSNEETINPDLESAEQSTEELVEETQATEEVAQAAEEGPGPEAQIEALQDELTKTKDDALRTLADAQNIKRRAEGEIDKARKFALEKFASELLGVADNLERALEAADTDNEAVKPLAEGVELTQKTLVDALAKFNVKQLDPVGEPFDPQFHQAMSMVENPDVEPNTVTLVMQKGYTLNERLLRPAMVMVSKAAAGSIDENA
ncbi:MAG: nucleotide exchange factor GrpE [Oceanicoccus sp.]|uniref:nucleotide exchange factor GrpE n=1 Tax=Oceanicoccus sp. TaxID=2691044 RepID=UPI0026028A52|nr:nucleotide exchange factor GrpE [Oceanicoccus sp.]MDG1772813.1 nucleotide exchange factor GrpE [Oceanicoccus sp.]